MNGSSRWIWLSVALAFVVGLVCGAGIAWAAGAFNRPRFEIVEGYTTAVSEDGNAIGLERAEGEGVGYQIEGAWWREGDGPWQTHGPTCVKPLTGGQRLRLGVIRLEGIDSPRGDAVIWLECTE